MNVTFDLISLYITSLVLGSRLRLGGVIFASVIGGIYGVWGSVWCRSYILLAGGFICSVVLMCFLAYRPSGLRPYMLFAFILTVSILILGAVSYYLLIYVNSNFTVVTPARNRKVLIFTLVSLVSSTAITWSTKLSRRHSSKKSVCAFALLGDMQLSFRAISDTGNLLRDPATGKGVIVISAELAKRWLGNDAAKILINQDIDKVGDTDLVRRLRIVPYSTVGQRSLMWCILPDEITVEGIQKDALIGISLNIGKETAICPASLL